MIVPGRPCANGLNWWVFTKSDEPISSEDVQLTGPDNGRAQTSVHALSRDGDGNAARRAWLVGTSGLRKDQVYRIQIKDETAVSRTLPQPLKQGKPFTIGVASCFGSARGNTVGLWHALLEHSYKDDNPIRFQVLCGDQVYMDLDARDSILWTDGLPSPWGRYSEQWTKNDAFKNLLAIAPTLMMADDHEFWNNYPEGNSGMNWVNNLRNVAPPQAAVSLDRAFSVFQAALNADPGALSDPMTGPDDVDTMLKDTARTFDLDLGCLRVFVLDTRTARSWVLREDDARFDTAVASRFTQHSWLTRLKVSLGASKTPVVLFLSQPLIEEAGDLREANLPDFASNYAELCDAIFASPHDILIVSGDIHWGRLYHMEKVRSNTPKQKVYEFISSPLSRIRSWKDLADPDPKVVNRREGKITWVNGNASWLRCKDFSTDALNMYGTLTFTPQGTDAGCTVAVEATLWGLPNTQNEALSYLQQERFTLT